VKVTWDSLVKGPATLPKRGRVDPWEVRGGFSCGCRASVGFQRGGRQRHGVEMKSTGRAVITSIQMADADADADADTDTDADANAAQMSLLLRSAPFYLFVWNEERGGMRLTKIKIYLDNFYVEKNINPNTIFFFL
jgi:hypothetical protein